MGEQPAMDARHDMVEVLSPERESVATLPDFSVQQPVRDLSQIEPPIAVERADEIVGPLVFGETGEPVTPAEAVLEEVDSATPRMDEIVAPVMPKVGPKRSEAAKAFVGTAGPKAKGAAAPKAGAAPRGGAAPKAGASPKTGAAPRAGAVTKAGAKAPGANPVAVAKPKGKAVAVPKQAPKAAGAKAKASAKTKAPTKARATGKSPSR